MASGFPRARVLDLIKAQCKVFDHVFNPAQVRTGNKILRQRLRGPALMAYYPRKMPGIKDLKRLYPGMDFELEEKEYHRLEHNHALRQRGKGAPKKKRTFEESKKYKAMHTRKS